MARPIKLTSELHASISAQLQAGNYIEVICEKNRISRECFYNWLRRGEEDEQAGSKTEFVFLLNEVRQYRLNPKLPCDGIPRGKTDTREKYLYLVRESFRGLIKIGVASDLFARMSCLQIGCPQELTLAAYIKLRRAESLEAYLHKHFEHKRYRGEWFALDDSDIQTIVEHYGGIASGEVIISSSGEQVEQGSLLPVDEY